MKPQVPYICTSPYNDGPSMTGLERYRRWVAMTEQIAADPGIPADKRLHAEILLTGLGMLSQKRARRAVRPRTAAMAPVQHASSKVR